MSEGFDPQELLARAFDMQQRLVAAQAQAAAETVEGSTAGGKVRVTMTGTGEVIGVRIDPSVVVADEVELLEDLIVAALRDAATSVTAAAQESMGIGLGDLFRPTPPDSDELTPGELTPGELPPGELPLDEG